jgi:hypothetical protein
MFGSHIHPNEYEPVCQLYLLSLTSLMATASSSAWLARSRAAVWPMRRRPTCAWLRRPAVQQHTLPFGEPRGHVGTPPRTYGATRARPAWARLRPAPATATIREPACPCACARPRLLLVHVPVCGGGLAAAHSRPCAAGRRLARVHCEYETRHCLRTRMTHFLSSRTRLTYPHKFAYRPRTFLL